MKEFLREMFEKQAEYERKRIGDVFDACIARGCEFDILKVLDRKAWAYPENQARGLLYCLTLPNHFKSQEKMVEQYPVFLEELIRLRPNHEMIPQWQEALEIMRNGNYGNSE